jgi:hypothetical protein
MSDYQPIYDAVRSRLSNCDVGNAVESAIRDANISHYVERASDAFQSAVSDCAAAYVCPSAIYRPRIFMDGDQWCALYGDNLQDGVSGFGRSPLSAMASFDVAWRSNIPKESTG